MEVWEVSSESSDSDSEDNDSVIVGGIKNPLDGAAASYNHTFKMLIDAHIKEEPRAQVTTCKWEAKAHATTLAGCSSNVTRKVISVTENQVLQEMFDCFKSYRMNISRFKNGHIASFNFSIHRVFSDSQRRQILRAVRKVATKFCEKAGVNLDWQPDSMGNVQLKWVHKCIGNEQQKALMSRVIPRIKEIIYRPNSNMMKKAQKRFAANDEENKGFGAERVKRARQTSASIRGLRAK